MYSLRDRLFMAQFAAQAAARHRAPEPTGVHPLGVIVPGDAFMTEKISDPDYVPYCGPCVPMQRVRRVPDGFECPTCLNKSNWDLTKFNHNVDVQFDPAIVDAEWFAAWEKNKGLVSHLAANSIPIEEPKEDKPVLKVKDLIKYSPAVDWLIDYGKKNTGIQTCGKCTVSFFGKRSRKYCVPCQGSITQHVNQKKRESIYNQPFYDGSRRERRHG